MISHARHRPSPEWPFWLLLVAWLCANTPQTTVFMVLTWMTEGRSFTHQQRLTRDVARLLAGQKPSSPVAAAVARAQEHLPAKLPTPLSADAAMKKIELWLETTSELLPAVLRASHRREMAWRCPESQRREPPLGPPRMSVA